MHSLAPVDRHMSKNARYGICLKHILKYRFNQTVSTFVNI